jgi:hypothetical protein
MKRNITAMKHVISESPMRSLIVASLLASIALPAAASADAGPFGRNRQEQSSSSSRSSDDSSPRRSWSGRSTESAPARSEEAPRQRQNYNRQSSPVASPGNDAPRGWGHRDSTNTAPVAQQRQQAAESDGNARRWTPRQRSVDVPVVEQRQQRPSGMIARDGVQRDRALGRRSPGTRRNTQGGIGQYNESVRVNSVRPSNNSPIMSRVVEVARHRALSGQRWNDDWRRDRRYDWRRYRDYNRSLFYLGNYYDPWGYGYNRFQIGWSLWPNYYSQNYWINDPWMYRLPPAYGPYRWVRYWDDALLVNTYTGEVVDVVYDFFW